MLGHAVPSAGTGPRWQLSCPSSLLFRVSVAQSSVIALSGHPVLHSVKLANSTLVAPAPVQASVVAPRKTY